MTVALPVPGRILLDQWGIPLTQQCNDHDTYINTSWIRRYKAADQSITSNTTLQPVTDLSAPVEANTKYILDLYVPYFSLAAADIKIGWTLPALSSASFMFDYFDVASARQLGYLNTVPTTGFAFGGLGFDIGLNFKGSIEIGATPGTMTTLFAQNVSNATATWIRKGAYLKLEKV